MKCRFCFLLLCTFFCQSVSAPVKFSSDAIDLLGTTWIYIDEDDTYTVYFASDGRLVTTHPRDVTPDNDKWEQDGDILRFYYNDRYALHRGEIFGGDSIIGTAVNEVNKRWTWKMYRFRDSTQVEQ